MTFAPDISGLSVVPRRTAGCKVFIGSALPLVNCDIDETGTITGITSGAVAQAGHPDDIITQGLIDIQVNGFSGVDFNKPGLTSAQMDHALAHLAASGATCVLPTLITATETELLSNLAALDRAVSQSKLGPLMIPGYHIEGPFLSPIDGCAGAHPVNAMRPGSRQLITDLQAVSSRPILILTIAPEQEGVLDLIPFLTQQGVTCAIGHTAASRTEIKAAIAAGATLSTHLGNGLPHSLNKNENPLFSQLGEDTLTASFIVDGIHIHPQSLQTYFRAKTLARSIIVTDAVSAAGAHLQPGFYTIGETRIERHTDGSVRIPGATYLAGSSVTMDQMVRNLMDWYGFSMDDILLLARDNPAQVVGKSAGSLAVGNLANLVSWRNDGGALKISETSIGPWTIRQSDTT